MFQTERCRPVVLAEADCKLISQAVRVLARALEDDCRRQTQGALPDQVRAKVSRLRRLAGKMEQLPGMDCSAAAVIRDLDSGVERDGPELYEADWRIMATALGLLRDRLEAAGDREHARRMGELSAKAAGAGDWYAEAAGLLRGLDGALDNRFDRGL